MAATDATKNISNAQVLRVRIVSATQPLWEGEAVSVSSTNSSGPFDVLPMHANFISLVKQTPIVVKSTNGEKHEWRFEQAVIYVHENEVRIYADFVKNIVRTR